MKAVQVVIDDPLLRQVDKRARELSKSRSEVIRDSLRAQLRSVVNAEADGRVRAGYSRHPERVTVVSNERGLIQAWEEEDWSDVWKEARSAGSGSRRRTRKGRS